MNFSGRLPNLFIAVIMLLSVSPGILPAAEEGAVAQHILVVPEETAASESATQQERPLFEVPSEHTPAVRVDTQRAAALYEESVKDELIRRALAIKEAAKAAQNASSLKTNEDFAKERPIATIAKVPEAQQPAPAANATQAAPAQVRPIATVVKAPEPAKAPAPTIISAQEAPKPAPVAKSPEIAPILIRSMAVVAEKPELLKAAAKVEDKKIAELPAPPTVAAPAVHAWTPPAGLADAASTKRPLSIEEVRRRIASTKNFTGENLANLALHEFDFSGADLTGANLQNTDLYRANFTRAKLPGANLKGSSLERANFSGANMKGAKLSECSLFFANLQGTDLESAQIRNCYADGVKLQRANLKKANFRGTNLSAANIEGSNLAEAVIEGTFLGKPRETVSK